MSRLFSSIIFTFFLLFQSTALAEEDTPQIETNIEEPEVQESEAQSEMEEAVKPQEEISEAQKEAQAAEEAEIRESGMGEEVHIN